MIKGFCPRCGRIIIEDIESYLEEYPDENWIQCCYCHHHFPMKKIKKEIKESGKSS